MILRSERTRVEEKAPGLGPKQRPIRHTRIHQGDSLRQTAPLPQVQKREAESVPAKPQERTQHDEANSHRKQNKRRFW